MSNKDQNRQLPVEEKPHEHLQNGDYDHQLRIEETASARLQRSVDLLDWEVKQMEILIRQQQDLLSKTLSMQRQLVPGTSPAQQSR